MDFNETLSKYAKIYNSILNEKSKKENNKLIEKKLLEPMENYLYPSNLISYKKDYIPNNEKIPVTININPLNNEIQKSGSNFFVSIEICIKDNTKSFKPNEIEIEFFEDIFYYYYKVIVDQTLDYSNPFETKIQFRAKPNNIPNILPKTFLYKIKVCDVDYFGKIDIDLTWFVSDFATPYNLNVFVDGNMGTGKSSILNLIFNLFTSSSLINNVFMATKSPTYETLGIQYNSIKDLLDILETQGKGSPIYESIKKNIKITLVDKIGICGDKNQIDYLLASKGCYADNDEVIEVISPQPDNECHAFIFVISMKHIFNKSEFNLIKERIENGIISAKIIPLLVITFSDLYSSEEKDVAKKAILSLPVEKEKIFFITPYIDSMTGRDPEKYLNAWKLMKCIIEVSQQTMFKKINLKKKNSFKKDPSTLASPPGPAPDI